MASEEAEAKPDVVHGVQGDQSQGRVLEPAVQLTTVVGRLPYTDELLRWLLDLALITPVLPCQREGRRELVRLMAAEMSFRERAAQVESERRGVAALKRGGVLSPGKGGMA